MSSGDGEGLQEDWGRKPLALQRILSENTAVRPRGRSKEQERAAGGSWTKSSSCGDIDKEEDKENDDDEGDWYGIQEPMSSTVMDKSAPETESVQPCSSGIFSTSDNLSSISLPLAQPVVQGGKVFKTPKRREEEGEVGTPGTPVSSTRTRSSGSSRTPGSSGASRRGVSKTPSSSGSGTRWNPFDCHRSFEQLHQQTMSPGVFATVVSPSQDCEETSGRFWSIEQQADMFPTAISEDSPLKQSLYMRHHSREMENKTQEQIELYFASHHTVTSPPDLPPTGPLLLDSRETSYCQAGSGRTASTQTSLSLPPLLPPELEAALAKYCTVSEPLHARQNSDEGPPAALSNSTLRRKLFNGDAMTEDSDSCSSSRSSSPCSAPLSPPCPSLTPGRVIHTPSNAWSSSPVRRGEGRAASFSPPDQCGSPIFSPIVRERASRRSAPVEERMDSSEVRQHEISRHLEPPEVESGEVTADLTSTSLLYHTADSADTSRAVQEMDTDSNSGAAWVVSGRQDYCWASSTARDGWTEHTRDEPSSRAGWTASLLPDVTAPTDTGYGSQGPSVCSGLTSPQPSSSVQDSGLTSARDESAGVSAIAPESTPVQDTPVLFSYAAEGGCNDISVGFPLGSSTPTKN